MVPVVPAAPVAAAAPSGPVPVPIPKPGPIPVPVRPSVPATLPLFQTARYDIRYGLLGSVGALTFSVGGVRLANDGAHVVNVQGAGRGAVLGLGGIQRKIEAEFDPATLESRRWSILRARDGQPEADGTLDTAARGPGGTLLLGRATPGQPPSRQTVQFTVPTSDPLGLLWRLRTRPPAPGQTETVQLLDGLALWRVRITGATTREILPEGNQTAMRLDGDVSPILYDGQADPERPTRHFTLWLSDATDHLPLRLEVPVGIADIVMTLAESHTLANRDAASDDSPSRGAVALGALPDRDPNR